MIDVPRFTAPTDAQPSPAMLKAWRRDGMLIVENAIDPADCDALIERSLALVDAWNPEEGAGVFSTTAPQHAAEAYFRGSGDTIRVFLEAGAVDTEGRLTRSKRMAVNKLGHAMHDLDPVFAAVSRRPALAGLARGLGLADPRLVQSMIVWKPPGIGGEVVCHQDATFLITEPDTVIGFWLALEDADISNGCLYAIPGGHLTSVRQQFRQVGEDLVMQTLDATPFDEAAKVALPARKGTVIVLHGRLPHGSAPNISEQSRMAYTLHVVDGTARWSPDNWLKRGAGMPFRGFEGEAG